MAEPVSEEAGDGGTNLKGRGGRAGPQVRVTIGVAPSRPARHTTLSLDSAPGRNTSSYLTVYHETRLKLGLAP